MGGAGSGRWRDHTPKPLVELTAALDLHHPKLRCVPAHRGPAVGDIEWTQDGARRAHYSFALGAEEPPGRRELVLRSLPADPSEPGQVLELVRARQGCLWRWFAVCPACEARRLKLYLVGERFLCRECGGLTYRSAREHDKRVDELVRDRPRLMRELENPSMSLSYGSLARHRVAMRAIEKITGGELPWAR
jgi:hypothetical protein